jgi:SAM-dependent methyltransferase
LYSLSTRPSSPLTFWFALATFWCSALIFWVEPLIGKQLLPLLGGAPAVWNICLLFFQTALLLGYAVAHGLTHLRSARLQAVLYFALFGLGLVVLPVQFTGAVANQEHPGSWLLWQLTMRAGLPLIALAAASPLLQHWFACSQRAQGSDPYFLYAASNAGSLIALLAYPFVIEPAWRIQTQNHVWGVLYVAAIGLLAIAVWRARPSAFVPVVTESEAEAETPTLRGFAYWVLLAAIPSSLLLGVTSYLTMDLAPVPLLWVVPLAVYLLSFIIAFGWLRSGPSIWLIRAAAILAGPWVAVYRLQPSHPMWLLAALHIVFFAILAVNTHSRLAESRPAARYLTHYYLAIALGGALGGAFNALLAPLLFNSLVEYPAFALIALFVAAYRRGAGLSVLRDVLPAAALGVIVLMLVNWRTLQDERTWAAVVGVGVPCFVAYAMSGRIPRYVLALAAILFTGLADGRIYNRVLYSDRNFYGLLRVSQSRSGRFIELRHGNTLHGAADRVQPGGSEPLTYYSLAGPIADVLNQMQATPAKRRVGVVGLGVGTMAYYGIKDEVWDFFEINPAVERLARDSSMFGYLQRSDADTINVITGDARLSLQHVPDARFDLLVLDAFTSDAIPLHLLTREAVQLYFRKTKPGGLVVFHTSNRYLDLAPVLGDIAHSLRLVGVFRDDWTKTTDEQIKRIEGSSWVVLARTERDLAGVSAKPFWHPVQRAHKRVWTDDYSNVWSAWGE